jgi:hypothetical protein
MNTEVGGMKQKSIINLQFLKPLTSFLLLHTSCSLLNRIFPFQKQLIICKFVSDYNLHKMKSLRNFTITVSLLMLLSSCGMLSNMFKRKSGCPSNGKNVGAEKILSGDPKAMKDVKKAKKFKS